ncbi:MAG TPA: anti-sigma factor [Gaiellaceae bacterium]
MDTHDLTAAYALHALDAEEREAYEEHLAQCARCRDELAQLQESAAALAWAVEAPAPPAPLRARILAEATAGRENVVPLPLRARRGWQAAAAVAACTAVGLGIWAATLHDSLGMARAHESALQIAADPASHTVAVHGGHGMVAVARNGVGVLVVDRLPVAPDGKTYEAWVIPRGGKPVRAGTFEGGDGMTMVELQMPVPPGATVAATVERDGGVDAPTTKPFLSAET